MHVTIITAFPEFFKDFLSTSIVGRAVKNGVIKVDVVNLRDFGRGQYRQIDDYSFGSGGMVIAAPPLADALDKAREGVAVKSFVVYPSPQGVPLTQGIVETLHSQQHVVIVCGHYEGLDERFVESEVQLEVSVGDCVLTGGEIPAMAIVDAMSRLVPGVVGRCEAVRDDSFYRGMLDHPHYTRPFSWDGREVPPVLLSGNAADISEWRRVKAVERTVLRRPDLLYCAAAGDYMHGRVYLAVLRSRSFSADSSVSELVGLCGEYGVRPIYIIPDPQHRAEFSDNLPEGVKPRLLGSIERAAEWITEREKGIRPLMLTVTNEAHEGQWHWLDLKRMCLEYAGPLLFLFEEKGWNFSHAPSDLLFTSINSGSMPLNCSMAITLDRFLGRK